MEVGAIDEEAPQKKKTKLDMVQWSVAMDSLGLYLAGTGLMDVADFWAHRRVCLLVASES